MKTISIAIRIIGLLIALSMTSCNLFNQQCPGYPSDKLNWLPNEEDSCIYFSNGSDTVSFVFDERYISAQYDEDRHGECEALAVVKTSFYNELLLTVESMANAGRWTELSYEFMKWEEWTEGQYRAERSDVFFFDEENGAILNYGLGEYTFNDHLYENVLKLELDTGDEYNPYHYEHEIWRVFIADTIGLVGFDDCKTRQSWRRIQK